MAASASPARSSSDLSLSNLSPQTQYGSRIYEASIPYLNRNPRWCTYRESPLYIVRPSSTSSSKTGPFQITVNGFTGSQEAVFLTARNENYPDAQGLITLGPPGYVAAPRVHMVASHSIRLGARDIPAVSGMSPLLTLFAPDTLEIRTTHLIIGDLKIEEPYPLMGRISCTKLTMMTTTPDKTPSYFQIVSKWLVNDPVVEVKPFEKLELLRPYKSIVPPTLDSQLPPMLDMV
jgi:hypothetical protein